MSKSDDLRMGQRFCNMYIKGSWDVLFYADDDGASWMIQTWLRNNHHFNDLPEPM